MLIMFSFHLTMGNFIFAVRFSWLAFTWNHFASIYGVHCYASRNPPFGQCAASEFLPTWQPALSIWPGRCPGIAACARRSQDDQEFSEAQDPSVLHKP